MFFITTLKIHNKTVKDSRTVGYLDSEEEALDCLENNRYDLYEYGTYEYAILENIPKGIYRYDYNPKWFKWDANKGGFFICEKPDLYIDMVGYAFG